VLIVLAVLTPIIHRSLGGVAHWALVGVVAVIAGWAALADHGADERHSLMVILVGAAAMRLAALCFEPYQSTDIYRYIWDGRVQAAGINPYRYVPAAPELAALRDTAIYPKINRVDYAKTIYPPTAQTFFFVVTRLGENIWVMRLALLACEALTIWATLAILKQLGFAATRIAALAWHPLAVWEIANNGHIDAAMVTLLLASVLVFTKGRVLLAGALATAAALVKPTALLVLPAFWKPWDLKLPAVVIGVAALLYAPYLAVGTGVFGFLSGYVGEEELSHGSGFRYVMILERLFGPLPAAPLCYAAVSALILVGLGFWCAFRSSRNLAATVGSATVLVTAFLILLTPHYPWYYLALVPFLCVYPRSATLWLLTVGGLQTYNIGPPEMLPAFDERQILFHTLVLVAVVADTAPWRWRIPWNAATDATARPR
jgi:hypothetical protein